MPYNPLLQSHCHNHSKEIVINWSEFYFRCCYLKFSCECSFCPISRVFIFDLIFSSFLDKSQVEDHFITVCDNCLSNVLMKVHLVFILTLHKASNLYMKVNLSL